MWNFLKAVLGLFSKKSGQEKPNRIIRKKEDRKTSIPREEIKKVVAKEEKPMEQKPEPKGVLKAKNDSTRMKYELIHMRRVNRDMYDLLVDLSQWVAQEFQKDTIMTMLFRTQEEQEQIYGKGTTKKSPHQFYHAADIRSRIFSDDEIKRIEDYLNNKYNSTNYYRWTAKNHKVAGGAYHFHIQYIRKK